MFQTSEKVETIFLMTESGDQDQPMVDQPQVVTRNLMGPPPTNPPPPPPPGACMTHADDVTEEGASKHEVSYYEVSDDEPSSPASDSDTSEDAISVVAQAAVEDAVDAAVRQAQSPHANHANEDSIHANSAVSSGEREAANVSTRTLSVHDGRDSEVEGGWSYSLPPSLPRPTSQHSLPHSANQTQPSDHSDDDDELEVTPEVETCPMTPAPVTAPVKPAPVTPAPVKPAPVTPAPVTPAPVKPAPVKPDPVTPAPV
uniref:Uncharacterized protein n=1 Tax=Cyclopterus lumpus TaxID=8103 RepID=A0A8C2X565_CYCLU